MPRVTKNKKAQPPSQKQQFARITPHPDLQAEGTTLKINLNLHVKKTSILTGKHLDCDHDLLAILPEYKKWINQIIFTVAFPAYHQAWQVKNWAQELVLKIMTIVNNFYAIEVFEMVLTADQLRWEHVRIAEPLYGLRFLDWCLMFREESGDRQLGSGEKWDVDLARLHVELQEKRHDERVKAKAAAKTKLFDEDGFEVVRKK